MRLIANKHFNRLAALIYIYITKNVPHSYVWGIFTVFPFLSLQKECTSRVSVQRWIWKWQLTFGAFPLLGLVTVQTHHKSTFLADPVNVKQCGFTCVAALSHSTHRSLPGDLGCRAKQTGEGWNRELTHFFHFPFSLSFQTDRLL